MRLTLNRLKFYEMIANECRCLAEQFNEVTQTYNDLYVDEDADVSINLKKKFVYVDGSYTQGAPGGYSDYQNYTLYIPFAYIEDPIEWQDKWEEDQHQEMLDKIQKKIEDKRKKEDQLEAHDRAEYQRLKEKYE
jgi:hypothetical protein